MPDRTQFRVGDKVALAPGFHHNLSEGRGPGRDFTVSDPIPAVVVGTGLWPKAGRDLWVAADLGSGDVLVATRGTWVLPRVEN